MCIKIKDRVQVLLTKEIGYVINRQVVRGYQQFLVRVSDDRLPKWFYKGEIVKVLDEENDDE